MQQILIQDNILEIRFIGDANNWIQLTPSMLKEAINNYISMHFDGKNKLTYSLVEEEDDCK